MGSRESRLLSRFQRSRTGFVGNCLMTKNKNRHSRSFFFQNTCFVLITQIFSDQKRPSGLSSASSCDQQMGADRRITVTLPAVSCNGTRSFQSQADCVRTGGLASRPVHAFFQVLTPLCSFQRPESPVSVRSLNSPARLPEPSISMVPFQCDGIGTHNIGVGETALHISVSVPHNFLPPTGPQLILT